MKKEDQGFADPVIENQISGVLAAVSFGMPPPFQNIALEDYPNR